MNESSHERLPSTIFYGLLRADRRSMTTRLWVPSVPVPSNCLTMSNVHGLYTDRSNDDDSEDESNNRFVGGIDARGGGRYVRRDTRLGVSTCLSSPFPFVSFVSSRLYLSSGLAVEPKNDEGDAGGASNRDSVFNLAEQAGSDEPSQVRRTITMYRDGFVVDDGAYRRLDDPANADFLRSLAQGRTPAELVDPGVDASVTVGLIDKRREEYVEEFQSFSGEGATLGAVVSGNTVDPASLPAAIPVDPARPSTSIQVRLPNGQRKVIKIQLDATVLQLAAHIKPLVEDSAPFRLVSGFPPKPLEDFAATVEAAGLKGAQVQIQTA
jgi:UBX domain-containing protein 1